LKISNRYTLFTRTHTADNRSMCKQLNVNKYWPISIQHFCNKLHNKNLSTKVLCVISLSPSMKTWTSRHMQQN